MEKVTTHKVVKKVKEVKEESHAKSSAPARYFEAVGRRKTAVARVRFYSQGEAKHQVTVNGQSHMDYFKVMRYQMSAVAPLKTLKINTGRVEAKVSGGGVMAQSEAVTLGIARALTKFDETFRKILKPSGFLTRDARAVERKKFGLKKARRANQWKKR